MLVLGGVGHARVIAMPAFQCDRVRIYRTPTGVPLNKAVHLVADVPCKPGVELQYVDGDPNIINVALSDPTTMGRQWARARFIDDFNRANAALNASPVASIGGSWVHDGAIANAASITNNQLTSNTADSTGSAYKTPPVGSADHWVQAKVGAAALTANTNSVFICCRLTDRNNFVGMRWGMQGWEVYRRVAGTLTVRGGSATPVPVLGDVFRLECSGDTWIAKRNGVQIGTGLIGDASLTSADTGVVVRNGAVASIDEFMAGLVAPPTARYSHAGTNPHNRVMTSSDGINWLAGSVPIDASPQGWEALCWSPDLGRYLAVASSGGTPTTARAMTSPDGINWTVRTMAISQVMRDVCWGGPAGAKLFVAVASSASTQNIQTSPDGITWTARTKADTIQVRGVCWSPELSLFVAVGQGICYTSPDGITWTLRTIAANTWLSVCWAASLGLFVAVASDLTNRVATSPDGINWTSRTPTANMEGWTMRSVCWSPALGRLVAISSAGTGSRIAYSDDGITWVEATASSLGYNRACWAPELGLFVAVNGNSSSARVSTSPDGITWTNRANAPVGPAWVGLCWGGGKLIAGATSAGVSSEQLTWGGMGLKIGDKVCYSFNLVSGEVAYLYVNPSRNQSSTMFVAPGMTFGVSGGAAINADADAFGLYANTDKAAVIESVTIYKATAKMLLQGYYDYYVIPTAGIGIESDVVSSQIGVLVT